MNSQLSNPFSTGGGGPHFEVHVQASFVALMLTDGFAPYLPGWPIKEIKLQGKFEGYDTDDLIVFVESPDGIQKRKMLAQIKHSVSITENNKIFREVISAAWNDFNSCDFLKNKDIIALITGPLSATDVNDVRTILEWARHSNSADEFINKVDTAHFSSKAKQKKLQAFRTQLKHANTNQPVEDEILFEFLKHFHLLGYDLDVKAGVSLSFIHSLIHQYSQENVQNLWARLVDEVQSANKNAGTISRDSLPEDLRDSFKQIVYESVPDEFASDQPKPEEQDWNQHEYASELAIANLLGAWNELNEADLQIVCQLADNEDYARWIPKLREMSQQATSPVTFINRRWQVIDRKGMWQALGGRIFDYTLDALKQCAVTVLPEQGLKYSKGLQKGLAETLVLLGTNPGALTNFSPQHQGWKPRDTAVLAVREIFKNADWKLWGNLYDLLPLLAEAAPNEFLDAVENALDQSPCPFDELFSQERDGVGGRNYLAGLLWALETLAWDAERLVRVCVILGELAARDPGSQWSNRPANSLTEIIHPQYPHTEAPIEKREVAVKKLVNELPDVAWNLLISLLPGQYQIFSGTHKPEWRNNIPDDRKELVPPKDYWGQVNAYAEMAISMASNDIDKLAQLVGILNTSGSPSFDKLLAHLSSEEICGKPDGQRLKLWTQLTELASNYRRFSNKEPALIDKIVSKVEDVAAKLAPENPFYLYRILFSSHAFDLYEESETGEKRLNQDCQQAIKEILADGGMDMVLQFAESVESPWNVGRSLGAIAQAETDKCILPALLETENTKLSLLTSAYISCRQYLNGWKWVDGFDTSNWSATQIGQFLSYLPITKETWHRATDWLGKSEKEYWSRMSANPYQTDGDLGFAIDKLIAYDRPYTAIRYLCQMKHNKQPLDKTRSVKALIAAISSQEPPQEISEHNIIEIIKILQDDPDTDPDDLSEIEWAYMDLLNGYYHRDASPKTLEIRLASDPEFFCEVIRLRYPQKKETESPKEFSEREKTIANNAYKLLDKWRIPPGTQSDGQFLPEQFEKWLTQTKDACDESGHLDVALMYIGKVLIHAPPDPEGLWIHRTVASVLDAKDAEKMRDSFWVGILNSRGIHKIDPTGKPERELAEEYNQKAEKVENAGYHRFAVTLRKLAEGYEREAEVNVAEHIERESAQ